jgi:hypothetical protein
MFRVNAFANASEVTEGARNTCIIKRTNHRGKTDAHEGFGRLFRIRTGHKLEPAHQTDLDKLKGSVSVRARGTL